MTAFRGLFIGGLLLAGAGGVWAEEPPPSVVMILSDDQGFGDVHSHGNDKIDTPVLDRLAGEGIRFDRFFVSPICAPTRAALMTGRYHLRTGVVEVVPDHLATMQLDEVTLGEAFRQAGYATGMFGKWHLGKWYPYHPNVQGFDEFFGFRSGAWGNYFDTTLEYNGKQVPTEGYITDVLFPTLIELCGIEAPKTKPRDGKSLAPLMLGHDTDWPARKLFSVRMDESPRGNRRINGIAVRTPRWRLTVYGEATALYDMVADPNQRQNIAVEYPEVVAELRADIERWYADVTQDSPSRVPIPIGYEVEPIVELKAPDAHLKGTISVAGKTPSDIQWIHSWTTSDDHAWWDIGVIQSGVYEILVTYSNPLPCPPLAIRVEVGGASIEAELPVTGSRRAVALDETNRAESNKTAVAAQATKKLGELRLPSGEHRFYSRVADTPGSTFQLNGYTLKRTDR